MTEWQDISKAPFEIVVIGGESERWLTWCLLFFPMNMEAWRLSVE